MLPLFDRWLFVPMVSEIFPNAISLNLVSDLKVHTNHFEKILDGSPGEVTVVRMTTPWNKCAEEPDVISVNDYNEHILLIRLSEDTIGENTTVDDAIYLRVNRSLGTCLKSPSVTKDNFVMIGIPVRSQRVTEISQHILQSSYRFNRGKKISVDLVARLGLAAVYTNLTEPDHTVTTFTNKTSLPDLLLLGHLSEISKVNIDSILEITQDPPEGDIITSLSIVLKPEIGNLTMDIHVEHPSEEVAQD